MKVIIDVCELCKETFTKSGNNQNYCSRECYARSRIDYVRNWRVRKPELTMFAGAKHRAKKRNIEFTIEVVDIKIPTVCPVFGTLLKRNFTSGYHDDSPSLDRIDNTKGYIPGNVRVISNRANALKSNATIEELEALVIDARNIRS